ncbi:MAG: DNA internalization-related competence protein ComEC/Rec2 [Pirellulales bacterium]
MTATTSAAAAQLSRPRQRHPLVVVLAAAAIGMVVDRHVAIGFEAWLVAAAATLAVWFAFRLARRDRAAQFVLLLAVAAVAGLWHHDRWHLFAADDIGLYADLEARPVCVEGVTQSLPRYVPAPPHDVMRIVPAEDGTRVELEIAAIRDGDAWRDCSGRATLYVGGRMADHAVGTRVRVYAMLVAPRPLHNPGEFDFAEHARGDRTLARITAAQEASVVPLDEGASWSVAAAFEQLRRRGHDILWRHIDADQAPLASAVLLGEREYIDSDVMAAYIETGAVHLLSISGLHLGILAGFMFFLLRLGLLPSRWGLIAIAVLVVLYARLTDSNPPVVRATVLVVTLCAGALLGRRALQWNTLAAAAIVVLAMNPAELFRVGAQLSFLCMAVFAAFDLRALYQPSPDALDRLLRHSDPWPMRWARSAGRWAAQVTLASLAVWLLTMPLIMARFHLCTPIAVLLNAVVWLPMALAMLFGFLVMLVGGLVPPLGDFFGSLCGASFHVLDGIVDAARSVPGGRYWVPGPDDWWMLVFYLLLATLVALPRGIVARRWRAALVVGWIGVAFAVGAWRALPRDRMDVTFLSVGHGCAVVVELPDGRTLLYDAGHMGSPESGGRSIAGYLWWRGITRIDGLVISHADADHFNAVPYLMERFDVGTVMVSPVMFDERGGKKLGAAVRLLMSTIDDSRARLETIADGDQLAAGGGVSLRVLSPPASGVVGSDNSNSVVLAIDFCARRVLLTGDLEGAGLSRLIERLALDCDVLLAPHHGSPASSPLKFARWAAPEWAVVSGGFRGNPALLAEVYGKVDATPLHTARVGAVRVAIDLSGMEVTTLGRRRFAPR